MTNSKELRDKIKRPLLNSLCEFARFEKCVGTYRSILTGLKNKEMIDGYNSFGFVRGLVNLYDFRLSKPSIPTVYSIKKFLGEQLGDIFEDEMEKFLKEYCNPCSDPKKSSIVAFRIDLGVNSRKKIEYIIGNESELKFTGICSVSGETKPMIIKPDFEIPPEFTTVDRFLNQNLYVKPEYFSLKI